MSSPDIVTIISILPQVAQLQDLESSGATICGINAHNNQFATPTNPNPPSWSYLLFVMYLQATYFEIFLHLYVAQCDKCWQLTISNFIYQMTNMRYVHALALVKYQISGMPLLLSNIRYAPAIVKYQVCPSSSQISNIMYAPPLVKHQISGMPQLLSNIKYQVCPMLLSNIKYAPALVSRHKTWRDSATSGSSLTPEFPTKTKLTKSNFHEDIVYGL